jgi:hypothetical protein
MRFATIAGTVLLTSGAALGLAGPASADNVTMTCSASGADPLQNCDGGVLTRSLSERGNAAWDVSFTLSADNNCAPLMMQVREAPNATGHPIAVLGNVRLDPGQTTPVFSAKNYDNKGTSIELHANGIQEGCNTGSLMGWSGDLTATPV